MERRKMLDLFQVEQFVNRLVRHDAKQIQSYIKHEILVNQRQHRRLVTPVTLRKSQSADRQPIQMDEVFRKKTLHRKNNNEFSIQNPSPTKQLSQRFAFIKPPDLIRQDSSPPKFLTHRRSNIRLKSTFNVNTTTTIKHIPQQTHERNLTGWDVQEDHDWM